MYLLDIFLVWNVTIKQKEEHAVVNHHESSINEPLLIDGNGYNGWNQPKNMGMDIIH